MDKRFRSSLSKGLPFSVLLVAALSYCQKLSAKNQPIDIDFTQYLTAVLFSVLQVRSIAYVGLLTSIQTQSNPLYIGLALKLCFDDSDAITASNTIQISVPQSDPYIARFVV